MIVAIATIGIERC